MRNKLSLRNCAILVALVAVTLVIGLYGTTNRSKTNGGDGGISLEPPPFISVAEADETGIMAFPADKAGISAYVKLPTSIDIDKVRTIFSKMETISTISTDVQLNRVQVIARWRHPEHKTCHALVRMPLSANEAAIKNLLRSALSKKEQKQEDFSQEEIIQQAFDELEKAIEK